MRSRLKLYRRLSENRIQCLACERKCVIELGKFGFCGVRKNSRGNLKVMVKNRPAVVNIDPVEKKPLFHFLPGSKIYSIGTVGCNFRCQFCQNWEISQINYNEFRKGDGEEKLKNSEVVKYCVRNGIKSIAFTYNEPVIFSEWVVEMMKLAKKHGIYGVFVSNGYMTSECLNYLDDYIDAYNIDLKGFSEKFYRKRCGASLAPVLRNIEEIYKRGKWIEITTLVIPGINDSSDELRHIARFLVNISKDIIWHLSAFYPSYKMLDIESTSYKKLKEAEKIGREEGLNYVYLGNVNKVSVTYCPKCGKKMIIRHGYLVENKLKKGICPACGYKLKGIWE